MDFMADLDPVYDPVSNPIWNIGLRSDWKSAFKSDPIRFGQNQFLSASLLYT